MNRLTLRALENWRLTWEPFVPAPFALYDLACQFIHVSKDTRVSMISQVSILAKKPHSSEIGSIDVPTDASVYVAGQGRGKLA